MSRRALLLAVPALLFIMIFFYAPFLILIYYSLLGAQGEFTLANYIDIFTSRFYLQVMGYSMLIAILTTIITLILAYPAAYYVVFVASQRMRPILITLLVAPFWIDFLLRAYSVKVLLQPLGVREGFATLMYGMVYDFFPFMLLPLYAGMSAVSPSIMLSARVHGANSVQLLTKILIPLTSTAILAGSLLVFLMSFTEFVIPALLGGVEGYTVGYAVYDLFFKYRDAYRGSALSIVLSLTALAGAVLVSRRVNIVRKIFTE